MFFICSFKPVEGCVDFTKSSIYRSYPESTGIFFLVTPDEFIEYFFSFLTVSLQRVQITRQSIKETIELVKLRVSEETTGDSRPGAA